MPFSPQPDPLDTSRKYSEKRADRDDWDATAATEGGARSNATGSTIHSDQPSTPLLAEGPLAAIIPAGPRRRLRQMWAKVGRALGIGDN